MQNYSALLSNIYQMQMILADMQARLYNLVIKKTPEGFNTFTRKNKIYYVSLPMSYNGPLLSRDHQTGTTMNRNIYRF